MNSWLNGINRSDILPPSTVKKSVKESDAWKKAMLDGFQVIGVRQLMENMKFSDYYRMVDGEISYQELSDIAPHLENLEDLLNGAGIPTFLKHYDIMGVIINALVGKYIEFQDKFHVVDTGEIADNEFLRYKNQELNKFLGDLIENEINTHMAENGLSPEGKKFSSPEEQQQFMSQLQQARQQFTPKDTNLSLRQPFKTKGVLWGEATLEKDKEMMDLRIMEKEEFKDKLITGRCFREYKMGPDSYSAKTWSPKNTFFSKEMEGRKVQDGEYVGRIQLYSPSECIKNYGHRMPAKTQKALLGGNDGWKDFVGAEGFINNGLGFSGSIEQSMSNNFGKSVTVPFEGFFDYNNRLNLEDNLGMPMGIFHSQDENGNEVQRERFLPRYQKNYHTNYRFFASQMRGEFEPRKDYCVVTEVYARVQDLWGYLTYESESGRIVTEEVTEDILPAFLKENNIKQTYTEILVDEVKEFKVNTLIWTYRPVVYEGVKIESENLQEPLYLYFRPCEHQIKGDSEFDVKLPVAGYIGKGIAVKIDPYQSKFNLCMNQIRNLLEKELGTFFLLDIGLIPSEFKKWGNSQDALVALRNLARDVGFLPVATAPDGQRTQSTFNQFATYDINYAGPIQTRVGLAETYQRKAYEVIGINPIQMSQNPEYTTATGVKLSNEVSYAQVAEIYEDFGYYNKGALEIHLSVAQYSQSNNKDQSLSWTKSDASRGWLSQSDPELPYRRLGLIPSADPRKRKELEEFKNYLLSTNNSGVELLEFAQFVTSDTMSEIVRIAENSRIDQENQKQAEFERQSQLLQQKSQQESQLAQQQWQMEETSKQADRDNKIQVAQVTALGRASDKQSDQEGFDEINRQAEIALKDRTLSGKMENAERDFKFKEQDAADKNDLAWAKLKAEAEKQAEKVAQRRSQEYIATVNKN